MNGSAILKYLKAIEQGDPMRTFFLGLILLTLTACTSLPDRVEPVSNFELNRYLGTWYEVARLNHSFERGLSQVQAEYSLRDDGGVKVINRGFDAARGEWREAEGKAYSLRTAAPAT
jgi:apolipoprotein D and lipocalin family protein